MAKTTKESNRAVVLEAFDTLFNKRNYKAAERYWSAAASRRDARAVLDVIRAVALDEYSWK